LDLAKKIEIFYPQKQLNRDFQIDIPCLEKGKSNDQSHRVSTVGCPTVHYAKSGWSFPASDERAVYVHTSDPIFEAQRDTF
jgi:hypothetical protein